MRLKWSTGIGTPLTLMVLLLPEVKTDMRFTSAHDHTAPAPADPYAAYGGFAAFTAFQQWQGYQQQVQTTFCIFEVMSFNFKNTHQCNVSLPR